MFQPSFVLCVEHKRAGCMISPLVFSPCGKTKRTRRDKIGRAAASMKMRSASGIAARTPQTIPPHSCDLLPPRAQLDQVALDRYVRWARRVVAIQNAKRGLLVEWITIARPERPEIQVPQKHIANPRILFFGAPH